MTSRIGPSLLAVVAASTIGACDREADTPRDEVPDDRPEPTKTIAEPPPKTQWLVWTREEDSVQTRWFQDGERPELLGVAEHAWIATPDSKIAPLWTYQPTDTALKQSDCECIRATRGANPEKPPEKCLFEHTLEVGTLRPLPDGDPLQNPPDEHLSVDVRAIFASLDGTVGSLAFVSECREEMLCGAAHGGLDCSATIWDLDTAKPVPTASLTDAPLKGAEAVTFVTQAYDDPLEAETVTPDTVDLTMIRPRWDEGRLKLDEQYTGPACYVCSDGDWDSYTISNRRTVETLPRRLAGSDATTIPAELSDVLQDRDVGGWSVVPEDPSVRELLSQRFGKPGAP